MPKARIRVHTDKRIPPLKVIRGTRYSPPAKTAMKKKPPEIGLRVVGREMGLYDGEESEVEPDLSPPVIGNVEDDVDASAMALKMFG